MDIHVNTRDEHGVKRPLDEKMAMAMGEAAKRMVIATRDIPKKNPDVWLPAQRDLVLANFVGLTEPMPAETNP